MSFDHVQAEPKKTYLNNLINLYFQTGINLIENSNFSSGLKAVRTMLLIIPCKPKEEVEALRNETQAYMAKGVKEEELYQLFEKAGALLNEHYFSELHLGIIPTSTLPGEKPKPPHEPIKEHAPSTL